MKPNARACIGSDYFTTLKHELYDGSSYAIMLSATSARHPNIERDSLVW